MAGLVCDRCQEAFDGNDGRCPKCMRKSAVRQRSSEPQTEAEALASGDGEPSTRTGLQFAFVGLSVVLSMVLGALTSSSMPDLARIGCEVPAAIGALATALVSIGVAPRLAIDEPHPWRTYLAWLGISGLTGASVSLAGLLAVLMVSDLAPVFTALVAVVLWLAMAIPAIGYARRRETVSVARPSGKWR